MRAEILRVIEDNNLGIEHMPSGIDTLSVIIDGSAHNDDVLDKIVEEIKQVCQPDTIDIERNLALIAVVGHGMSRKKVRRPRCAAACTMPTSIFE